MIIKDAYFGKHTNLTELIFGTGDINVSNGEVPGDPKAYVFFSNCAPRPMAQWQDEMLQEKSSDDIDLEVVMTFDKVESIDVLIRRLYHARENLIKK